MNWGRGIALALALFIGFIATLVIILISQKVDLVSEDYYSQELNFQQEIDGIEAGNNQLALTFTKKDDQLVVNVPLETDSKNITFHFYRANDKTLDKTFELENSKMLLIPMNELTKGNYSVRAEYTVQGKQVIQKYDLTI